MDSRLEWRFGGMGRRRFGCWGRTQSLEHAIIDNDSRPATIARGHLRLRGSDDKRAQGDEGNPIPAAAKRPRKVELKTP